MTACKIHALFCKTTCVSPHQCRTKLHYWDTTLASKAKTITAKVFVSRESQAVRLACDTISATRRGQIPRAPEVKRFEGVAIFL